MLSGTNLLLNYTLSGTYWGLTFRDKFFIVEVLNNFIKKEGVFNYVRQTIITF